MPFMKENEYHLPVTEKWNYWSKPNTQLHIFPINYKTQKQYFVIYKVMCTWFIQSFNFGLFAG